MTALEQVMFTYHKLARLTLTWTSIYDEKGDLLDVPITKKIFELEDDHLEKIVLHFIENDKYPPAVILNEIKYREL